MPLPNTTDFQVAQLGTGEYVVERKGGTYPGVIVQGKGFPLKMKSIRLAVESLKSLQREENTRARPRSDAAPG